MTDTLLCSKDTFANASVPPLTEARGRSLAGVCKRCAVLKSHKGFTLLEVLVAIALLGIAITVVLQLFSANLRAISASEDYVAAAARAEAKMREVLDEDNLTETSWSETTQEGYRIDVSVTDGQKERTENLQVRLLEINLTLYWTRGTKERSVSLKTLKVVNKQV